jgi:hypothetical protein
MLLYGLAISDIWRLIYPKLVKLSTGNLVLILPKG